MSARHAVSLLLLGSLSGCFLTPTPFPTPLAIRQLDAAKRLPPQSAEYDTLASLRVNCPATPATARQRDMACAQLWSYKASGCLKAHQDRTNAIAGRVTILAEERAAPSTALDCAEAASASAIAFLPSASDGVDGESVLKILVLRARTIELRRAARDTRDAAVDDAEIGAVAAQMPPLPDGAEYAAYFLAGTATRNATKAATAARAGPEGQRPSERATACAAAQGGLQILPAATSARALTAALAKRRDTLTRLTTEFCG